MARSHVRRLREDLGLSQTELASRAGVSRQLVGAVEAGRHLPRVDAALALASVLGVEVAALFETSALPVDITTGSRPDEGAVRVGRVGDRLVSAPARVGADGWDVADGLIEAGGFKTFDPLAPGLVVAGCEPSLELLEHLLREKGRGAVAVALSSAGAIDALAAGRLHAAVVHGPDGDVTWAAGGEVVCFRLARWRVGLVSRPDAKRNWWRRALSGHAPVVQREAGAGAQRAFESALPRPGSAPKGPRVGSHLEAVRYAVATGLAAVSIEPAALACGAVFHPLETHEAQLWVPRLWLGERTVSDALDLLSSRRFRRRLESIGGYDLSRCGERAA